MVPALDDNNLTNRRDGNAYPPPTNSNDERSVCFVLGLENPEEIGQQAMHEWNASIFPGLHAAMTNAPL